VSATPVYPCRWRALDGYCCVRNQGHRGDHTVYGRPQRPRPVSPPAVLPAGDGWYFMPAGLWAALNAAPIVVRLP
jgi:hypothetical protein